MKPIQTNWQLTWRYRTQIINLATKDAAEAWLARKQEEFKRELKIDEHPKEGWVVYCDPAFPIPEGIKLDTECVEYDLDINRMFFEGKSIPYMHDLLYLKCSVKTLRMYISERRKFEPERWPYRRLPSTYPKGQFQLLGYYLEAGEGELRADTVIVALWSGDELQVYCPIGQHSKLYPSYIAGCTPIRKEDYIKASVGYYTPPEYLT
jgi:hypothetical protein